MAAVVAAGNRGLSFRLRTRKIMERGFVPSASTPWTVVCKLAILIHLTGIEPLSYYKEPHERTTSVSSLWGEWACIPGVADWDGRDRGMSFVPRSWGCLVASGTEAVRDHLLDWRRYAQTGRSDDIMDTAASMATMAKRARARRRLEDSLDEIFEQYDELFKRLAGNGHTNGCSCLECQAYDFCRAVHGVME